MQNEIVIVVMAILLFPYLTWGFKNLPAENWQIMAAIPVRKKDDGLWEGINFTYYGFFTANAYVFSVAVYFVLSGSVHSPFLVSFSVCAVILAVCVPASKIVARIVEGKQATFTVGGATFIGIIIAPFLVALVGFATDYFSGYHLPVIATLSAITVSYALGEGTGRLACVSFGCCYGKSLKDSSRILKKLFNARYFIFSGKTKKASYEGKVEDVPVIPIQAITSIIYVLSGLVGVYLFLKGFYVSSFLESLIVTQGWRIASEVFRADYRGRGIFSAYQIMSALSIPYSIAIIAVIHDTGSAPPDIFSGLAVLWSPLFIVILQFLWAFIFIFTGKSMVTGSTVNIHVIKDRI
ncbi:MAG TPA: prolipoprotein diacylglyceryl transferase [Nitrospirae bacterium]|nr:prolipoprotein diacylglyceryl transferase [Nitrospirota bacterium]